jgi:tetratricopeptide (TPR) repeat protein
MLIWVICWWFARSESSSITQTLRAEAIVEKLRSPESTAEELTIAAAEGFDQKLDELSPPGTSLSTRFSGVIAEEALLQHAQPVPEPRFVVAEKNLSKVSLDLHSLLVQGALLFQQGKLDEAIRVFDDVLGKTAEQNQAESFPTMRAYAMLQKAALLWEQKKPNSALIEELQQFLSSRPDQEKYFDTWFSGNYHQGLAFIKVP